MRTTALVMSGLVLVAGAVAHAGLLTPTAIDRKFRRPHGMRGVTRTPKMVSGLRRFPL